MKEELVTFDTAKLAKEKGFDKKIGGHSYHWYKNEEDEWILINCQTHTKEEYSAPTQSLLQKWLREEHDIFVETQLYIEEGLLKHIYVVISIIDYQSQVNTADNNFSSFEKALEVGLQKALNLIP